MIFVHLISDADEVRLLSPFVSVVQKGNQATMAPSYGLCGHPMSCCQYVTQVPVAPVQARGSATLLPANEIADYLISLGNYTQDQHSARKGDIFSAARRSVVGGMNGIIIILAYYRKARVIWNHWNITTKAT